MRADFLDPGVRAKRRERMERIRAVMAKADPQREIPRNDELWYFEEREDVGDWFSRHGWNVTVTLTPELMASYHRRPPKEVEDTTPHNQRIHELTVTGSRVARTVCLWLRNGKTHTAARAIVLEPSVGDSGG